MPEKFFSATEFRVRVCSCGSRHWRTPITDENYNMVECEPYYTPVKEAAIDLAAYQDRYPELNRFDFRLGGNPVEVYPKPDMVMVVLPQPKPCQEKVYFMAY